MRALRAHCKSNLDLLSLEIPLKPPEAREVRYPSSSETLAITDIFQLILKMLKIYY